MAIKENEIRNGNLYYRIEEDFKPLENKKVIVWDESIWYRIGDCVDKIENYEPIPLTEEWLFKFGFEKPDDEIINNNFYRLYDEYNFIILLNPNNGVCYIYNFVGESIKLKYEIKYVNQLQNLYFTLIGQELQYNG